MKYKSRASCRLYLAKAYKSFFIQHLVVLFVFANSSLLTVALHAQSTTGFPFPPTNIVAEEVAEGVLLTWDTPGPVNQVNLFQHDGEIPDMPNAYFQQNTEVYGTVFDLSAYPDAVVSYIDFHHLQWGIPDDNYEYLVHIVDWSTFTILTTVGPLTTQVNDDWELQVPLGYYSVAGYQYIGVFIQAQGYLPDDAYPAITTDGSGPNGLSVFAPLNNLSNYTINSEEVGDFFITLWISTTHAAEKLVQATAFTSPGTEAVQTRQGLTTPAASATMTQKVGLVYDSVDLTNDNPESYQVFRLPDSQQNNPSVWVELQSGIISNSYVDFGWDDLDPGVWQYSVVADYGGDLLSEPAFSNGLEKVVVCPEPGEEPGWEVITLPYAEEGLTTCGMGNDLNSDNTISCGNSSYLNSEEIVLVFEAPTSDLYHITIENASESWSSLKLYDGCPLLESGSSCVAQTADSASDKILPASLEAGQTYYLVVSIDLPEVCPEPGSPGWEVISLPFAEEGLTTCGMGDDLHYYNTISFVFIFEAPTSDEYHFTLTNADQSWSSLKLYDGCPLLESGSSCVAQTAGSASDKILPASLEAGQTYYLVVSRFYDSCFTFDLLHL